MDEQENDKNKTSMLQLLERISKDKDAISDKFFLLSATYDKICKKYNDMSMAVLMLSAMVTLIEAIKMTILDYVKSNSIDIDTEMISFVVNILILTLGTVITVLSSTIRFKNYREIMQKLRDNEGILSVYKEKYNKKYDKVVNMIAFNDLSDKSVKHVYDKLCDYNNQVESINVLEHVRMNDVIRINRFKAKFDVEMKRIDAEKQAAIGNYSLEGETLPNNCLGKLISIERIKRSLLFGSR